ncbi:uncharacterized protein EMH_0020040 [Eimeria mitis]|uniref:Uncharacterized protein n=1 Tax=Eimeria mitis TaxID=44415 RepID=U6KFZ5_9EIME|nr:uncharacterized protein EMH_0020040 [Eimeria mitis]CDJ34373.1 hypothetical protein EMH_0020040 [Eimeria mitis]
MPQRQLARHPQFWTGGHEEGAELGQDDGVSRSDPEYRGFWSPHTHVFPSHPAYPVELWGTNRPAERGAHQYDHGPFGFPGLSTAWHFPGVPPAERPHLEPGMTDHPLAAAGSSTWHGMQPEFSRRGRSGDEMPRTPPIGMPVGEPERGIREQHGASAAGVGAALFSPDSADPSKSLRLLQKSSDEAD